MKSYISRKLPLTTRNTVLTLDSSLTEVACDAVDMTFSDKPGATWEVECGRLKRSTAGGKRMPRADGKTRHGRCIFMLGERTRYQGKRCASCDAHHYAHSLMLALVTPPRHAYRKL